MGSGEANGKDMRVFSTLAARCLLVRLGDTDDTWD